ncbi:hypothetical protein GQ44DRAFT_766109 [Phaeosphaeriaceae sp. PMI808]|nr:hypothetical protein GQ44DRAFT_766109 [Phaeosphaeriaceae sp. PMI808]
MASQKPSNRSTLPSNYITIGPDTKVTKKTPKARYALQPFRRYKDGLLNAAVVVRSKQMKIAKSNSLESPLLRLPGEIRTKIWKYALGYHKIDIGGHNLKRRWLVGRVRDIRPFCAATYFPRNFVRPNFALPRVCRQIYVESSAFIYTLNTFGFDSYTSLDGWVRDRPLGQKRLVDSVNIPYDYMHFYYGGFRKTFREKFPNITRVGVDEHVPRFSRKSSTDTIKMAKQRVVDFLRAKEKADLEVEWHYGVVYY